MRGWSLPPCFQESICVTEIKYRQVSGRQTRSGIVYLLCPRCRREFLLPRTEKDDYLFDDEDGTVWPSWSCPNLKCNFFEWVQVVRKK